MNAATMNCSELVFRSSLQRSSFIVRGVRVKQMLSNEKERARA
jgi:hypothetical protein